MLSLVEQTSMFVPEPVISLAIRPKGQETPNFSRALSRFQKEDPTFRVHVDAESQEVSHTLSFVYSIVDATNDFIGGLPDDHFRNGRITS